MSVCIFAYSGAFAYSNRLMILSVYIFACHCMPIPQVCHRDRNLVGTAPPVTWILIMSHPPGQTHGAQNRYIVMNVGNPVRILPAVANSSKSEPSVGCPPQENWVTTVLSFLDRSDPQQASLRAQVGSHPDVSWSETGGANTRDVGPVCPEVDRKPQGVWAPKGVGPISLGPMGSLGGLFRCSFNRQSGQGIMRTEYSKGAFLHMPTSSRSGHRVFGLWSFFYSHEDLPDLPNSNVSACQLMHKPSKYL